MRIPSSLHLLTACSTLVLFTACSSNHARQANDGGYSVSATWDSGPLDRSYQSERTSMEARHSDEMQHARPNESADQRDQRQSAEKADLEDRYTRGKQQHSNTLPPSNRQDNGHGGNNGHPNGAR
jgi:hypothetical protein